VVRGGATCWRGASAPRSVPNAFYVSGPPREAGLRPPTRRIVPSGSVRNGLTALVEADRVRRVRRLPCPQGAAPCWRDQLLDRVEPECEDEPASAVGDRVFHGSGAGASGPKARRRALPRADAVPWAASTTDSPPANQVAGRGGRPPMLPTADDLRFVIATPFQVARASLVVDLVRESSPKAWYARDPSRPTSQCSATSPVVDSEEVEGGEVGPRTPAPGDGCRPQTLLDCDPVVLGGPSVSESRPARRARAAHG